MRPLLLKGHTRPLTFIKYNLEGDILVSCAKDHRPTLWYADSGERIGTYKGHNGATWSCDITRLPLAQLEARPFIHTRRSRSNRRLRSSTRKF